MDESIDTTQTQSQPAEFDDSLPPGSHALEVAAHAGYGPLSTRAQEVWHGQSAPCVSCGQLVHRDDPACEHCGQDLSEGMIRKMRQHAGPWFVLEHVRPFPGVSLERIVRQIRRGLITETSIVRGPSSDYQWRFAVETPGLCRYFNKCWCCHGTVTLSDTYCQHCLHYLSFEKPRAGLQVPVATEPPLEPASQPAHAASPAIAASASSPSGRAATAPIRPLPTSTSVGSTPMRPSTTGTASQIDNRQSQIANPAPAAAKSPGATTAGPARVESPDLARLSAAVRQARVSRTDSEWDQPPRVGGVNVSWIAALLIVAAVVALLLISRARSDRPAATTSPALPTMPANSSPVSGPAPAKPSTTAPPTPAPSSPKPTTGGAGNTPPQSAPPAQNPPGAQNPGPTPPPAAEPAPANP